VDALTAGGELAGAFEREVHDGIAGLSGQSLTRCGAGAVPRHRTASCHERGAACAGTLHCRRLVWNDVDRTSVPLPTREDVLTAL
jgi:hypothetical protein